MLPSPLSVCAIQLLSRLLIIPDALCDCEALLRLLDAPALTTLVIQFMQLRNIVRSILAILYWTPFTVGNHAVYPGSARCHMAHVV